VTDKVTVPPSQNSTAPLAEIDGVGTGLTVITFGNEVPVQLLMSVTETEYEPAAVTLMEDAVAPFDHEYET